MARNQELFANNGVNTQLQSGVGGPAALSVEFWTVSPVTGFPVASSATAGAKTQFRIVDQVNPSEVILVTDTGTFGSGNWTVTRGWEGTTPLAHPTGSTFYQVITADVMSQATDDGFRSIMPTLAIAETAPRYAWVGSTGTAGNRLGVVYMAAIWLRQNTTVTQVNIPVVTASGTLTHFWAGLADNTGKQLCHSTDLTTGTLTATHVAPALLTVPFITTYTGLHYIIFSVSSASPAATYATTGYTASGLSLPPHLAMTSGTQAAPGTDGTTTYNVTAGATPQLYMYLS